VNIAQVNSIADLIKGELNPENNMA